MLLRVRTHQPGRGPLDRKAKLVKQLADMTGMIADRKLFFDDLTQKHRGPHSRVESIGNRATLDQIIEGFLLLRGQSRRATAAMAFK